MLMLLLIEVDAAADVGSLECWRFMLFRNSCCFLEIQTLIPVVPVVYVFRL